MKTLNIDIETFSDFNIKDGVYKYASSPNFDILLFAYSIDGGAVQIVDLTKEALPTDIEQALTDPDVLKIAYNAQFERVCLSYYLKNFWLDPAQWRCTMVKASILGLPASLGQCAKFLNIREQKDTSGTALINYFSKPCRPTKANGSRTRNLPEHDEEKWAKFKAYCVQDVVTEMAIADVVDRYPYREWALYALDQRINDRGVQIDSVLVQAATEMIESASEAATAKLRLLTGLDNPNSLKQMQEWLQARGVFSKSLNKESVDALLADDSVSSEAKEVLTIRKSLSNSSTKKYYAMKKAVCPDGRIRGVSQFYGANRTGRWAGRLIQTQNLPQNHLETLDIARELAKAKDVESIELLYESLEDILKQLIRTALVAKPGFTFLVSDFSAIEARVLAWLADETWRLDVFQTHGKIYEASASSMFHVPIEKIDKSTAEGAELRQRGKVAELAAGFQGSVGAMKAMDRAGKIRPDLSGVTDEAERERRIDANYKSIVDAWRKASPNIVRFWYDVESAAIEALENQCTVKVKHGIRMVGKSNFLFIMLPSGRYLSYAKPSLEENKFGRTAIHYYGKDEGRVMPGKLSTYGGKLVENITQAVARDLLAEKMKRLDEEGYDIVFHVHDEVVLEVEEGGRDIEEVNAIMAEPVAWAEGLPLSADGYETNYYKKD